MSAPVTPTTLGFIQAQAFALSGSGASVGDTTVTLQSMVGIDGSNILTADLGSFAYGTLEPGNGVQEEAMLFTGITQNANGTATLTGVSSIAFKQPYTITSGLTKTHAGASKFILSNDAAFYNNLILYVNAVAGAGAANASTTVKGIVQAATSAQINTGTATGSTGAVLAITPDALLASNFGTTNIPPPGLISPYAGSSAPAGWLLCDGTAVSRTTYASLFSITSTTYGTGDGSTTFNLPDLRGRGSVGSGTGSKAITLPGTAIGSNQITVTASPDLIQGMPVTYTGSGITGLTTSTVYYVITVSSTLISLATSQANANAGTVITISGTPVNGILTYALTARTLGQTGGEENHGLSDNEMSSHTHSPISAGSSGSGIRGFTNGSFTSNGSSGPNTETGSLITIVGSDTQHNNMSPFLVLNYIIKT